MNNGLAFSLLLRGRPTTLHRESPRGGDPSPDLCRWLCRTRSPPYWPHAGEFPNSSKGHHALRSFHLVKQMPPPMPGVALLGTSLNQEWDGPFPGRLDWVRNEPSQVCYYLWETLVARAPGLVSLAEGLQHTIHRTPTALPPCDLADPTAY